MAAVQVTASAPGKLMLFGEHAVVHGHPCLVTAVGIRVSASVEPIEGNELEIVRAKGEARRVSLDELRRNESFANRETAFVEAAVAQVVKAYPNVFGLKITTQGPPKSFGLGSSSAITVATVAAVVELLGIKVSQAELFRLAYDAVLAVQGKGSGFDVASAIYGGTIYFVTGGAEMEPLEIGELPICIGYSGEKVGTVGLVDSVGDLKTRQPALIGSVFKLIEDIVREAKQGLVNRDWRQIGDLMNINQGLLESLGVNTLQLARPIFAAREAGALGAKLSGAGGGDCMFALVEPEKRIAVEQAIQAAGAEVLNLEINTQGVRIEENSVVK